MNERLSNAPEPNDEQERRIESLMNTLGVSYAEALVRVGVGQDVALVSRQESRDAHPSNNAPQRAYSHYQSRYDGEAFDTIDTSDLSDEQLETNRTGIAAVKAALRRSREATSTPEEYRQYLLERKAAEERNRRS